MADGAQKQQFNVYIDEDLVKRVKHAAVDAGQRLSEFVASALASYLELIEEEAS
jgi:predicted HicB family RNase H-like nuclease